jgi:hypothetical protein
LGQAIGRIEAELEGFARLRELVVSQSGVARLSADLGSWRHLVALNARRVRNRGEINMTPPIDHAGAIMIFITAPLADQHDRWIYKSDAMPVLAAPAAVTLVVDVRPVLMISLGAGSPCVR